jgi:hypothetical protein
MLACYSFCTIRFFIEGHKRVSVRGRVALPGWQHLMEVRW